MVFARHEQESTMRFANPILVSLLVCSVCSPVMAAPATRAAQKTAPTARTPARKTPVELPPSEATAKEALDHSPRHGEYVDVPLQPGSTPIRTWISYPERSDKAGVVLVIHEIFGLSDWVRGVADALAREGFVAVVPDLISGMGPGGGGTDSVSSRDDVVALVRKLTPAETHARLDAVRMYAEHLPAANGKLATLGFCWGGGESFEYAAADPAPRAAVVYYGVSPDSATLLQVHAPVLGFYGGDDARITLTVDPTRRALAKLHQSYEPHVLPGAGHGFLRAQDDRDGANLAAARAAWPITIAFLGKHLR
jgi:carboxymethylenebutenolidase